MAKVSLEKDKIKFLLVEGVHQKALESLRAAGYTNIEFHKGALDDEQLKESIRDAHFIGLRSRTHLTEDVINAAEKLVAIGCFCIGTNPRLIWMRRQSAGSRYLTHRSQIRALLRSW